MKKINFKDKYPINTITINKNESNLDSIDSVVDYFKEKISEHPVAKYIATFDNYEHTNSLEEGIISSDIKAAKVVIFCFGKEIPNAVVLGVRPRAIGIAEDENSFTISFLDAPNPNANDTMIKWSQALIG